MDTQSSVSQVPQQLAAPIITPSNLCPHCHQVVSQADIFCPHCGKELIEKISLAKQIWIYFVSIAGPPLGIIYFFKYIGNANPTMRKIGIIALVLTIISSIITLWWGIGLYHSFQQQMQQFQGVGY